MKIIDAHLHFCTDAYFDEIARRAQHENSAEHLLEEYRTRRRYGKSPRRLHVSRLSVLSFLLRRHR